MVDYTVVDVFTSQSFKGNPVAVVLDGSKLTTDEMQQISKWTNLSETTFVLPPTFPEADYRLRIFCPLNELPFAGHPTLGSCHAVMNAGLVDKNKKEIIQECERGLITIKNDNGKLKFGIDGITAEELKLDEEKFKQCFPSLTPTGKFYRVDSGPIWLVGEVSNSAEELLAAKPNFDAMASYFAELKSLGINIFSGKSDIEMRTFAPGIGEDPVCGSGNAAVAYARKSHIETTLKSTGYKSSQGGAMGRLGKISLDYATDGTIWVGGECVSTVNGSINV